MLRSNRKDYKPGEKVETSGGVVVICSTPREVAPGLYEYAAGPVYKHWEPRPPKPWPKLPIHLGFVTPPPPSLWRRIWSLF